MLSDAPGGKPDVILIGTGSEVSLCMEACGKDEGRRRESPRRQHAVMGIVEKQDEAYKESVLRRNRDRACLRRNGLDLRLGTLRRAQRAIDRHAHASALRRPLKDLLKKFGFTVSRGSRGTKGHRRVEIDFFRSRRRVISSSHTCEQATLLESDLAISGGAS